MATRYPLATSDPYPDAGAFVPSGRKLVWHTTEGDGLPRYDGTAPHFTIDPSSGRVWQHVPIDRAASSLEHHGVETNHAHAIQVEIVGRASESGSWPDSYYANLAKLARWIESNAGVPRRCGVKFGVGVPRMSDSAWLAYSGHCGHEHVPDNVHWDPGALRIGNILDVEEPIHFTAHERKTLSLLMNMRQRPATPARLLKRAKYKATLLVYRQQIRDAARKTGWKINDRERRYKAILVVYRGGKISLG